MFYSRDFRSNTGLATEFDTFKLFKRFGRFGNISHVA